MKIFKTWKELKFWEKIVLLILTIFVIFFSIIFYIFIDTVKAGMLIYLVLVISIFEFKLKKWLKYSLVFSFVYLIITLSVISISKYGIDILEPIVWIAISVNAPFDVILPERTFESLFLESLFELFIGTIFYFLIGAFLGFLVNRLKMYYKRGRGKK